MSSGDRVDRCLHRKTCSLLAAGLKTGVGEAARIGAAEVAGLVAEEIDGVRVEANTE
jgi:hypothetical protein